MEGLDARLKERAEILVTYLERNRKRLYTITALWYTVNYIQSDLETRIKQWNRYNKTNVLETCVADMRSPSIAGHTGHQGRFQRSSAVPRHSRMSFGVRRVFWHS